MARLSNKKFHNVRTCCEDIQILNENQSSNRPPSMGERHAITCRLIVFSLSNRNECESELSENAVEFMVE